MHHGLSFDDIQKLVMNGQCLPDNSPLPEERLWEILNVLHRSYRGGKVTIEYAKQRAAKLRIEFDRDMMMYDCFVAATDRQNRYSHILTEAEKNGCPICKKIVRILDGRE